MNWISREHFKSAATLHDVDLCEHLENKPEQRTLVIVENDSFGVVGKMGLCQHCVDLATKAESLETDFCMDCKTNKPVPEITYWRPYDYYPQQGDQPYQVCSDCCKLEKHQRRVDKDQAEYEAECGIEDDWDE